MWILIYSCEIIVYLFIESNSYSLQNEMGEVLDDTQFYARTQVTVELATVALEVNYISNI